MSRNEEGYTFQDWYAACGEPLGSISDPDGAAKAQWRVLVDAWSNAVDPHWYSRASRNLQSLMHAPTQRALGYHTERDFNVPPTMRSPGMASSGMGDGAKAALLMTALIGGPVVLIWALDKWGGDLHLG